ncbi:unnamed protein product [Paramecium pentaurelia]|uniref:Uncharacterized protein n=1 Tax=Paramecium pentaurelia TaxID=43138 RepID=A0A8S1UC52_9CILI|nr:unnamed protein product [Paramecium pentaurelia]
MGIGIHKQVICRDISHILKLDEIEYLLVQCTKNNVELYISNIYSANSKSFRNQQKKLQIFIVQLKIKKLNVLIMIVRDANNSAVKLKGMIDLIPEFVKNKLRQSKTDIFQINQELLHSISFQQNNLSDHKLIICQLNLKKNLKSKKQYNFIINKEQIYLLNLNCSHSENFREFIQKIQENQKTFQIYRRKRLGLESIIHRTSQDFLNIFQLINSNIRTKQNKITHKQIKKLVIVNPNKRDGEIMNYYIDNLDNLIADQQAEIIKDQLISNLYYSQNKNLLRFNIFYI